VIIIDKSIVYWVRWWHRKSAKTARIAVNHALVSQARTECDRYVRENHNFYNEGTFSIFQFRQTVQQTAQGYDCESILAAEPAIRQLLKLDFEPKVSATIHKNFRQTVNNTLKNQLIPMAKKQAATILQQFNQARSYLEQTLEQEAAEKIANNARNRKKLTKKLRIITKR